MCRRDGEPRPLPGAWRARQAEKLTARDFIKYTSLSSKLVNET
jgi:hypothetical protein